MTKRKTTDAEKALFKDVIDTPRPLKAATPKPRIKKPLLSATAAKMLDGHTAEKLKQGKRAPELRIDLHGLTQARAHQLLLSFLRRAQKDGARLALVITGVGNPRREETADFMASPHGVLKQMVPRWLHEKEFAALVTGSSPAHRRHGGDGALYVTLRKNR